MKPHLVKSPRTHKWYCGYRFPFTNLSKIGECWTPKTAYMQWINANGLAPPEATETRYARAAAA